MKMVELNHMIAGSMVTPLTGSVVAVETVEAPTHRPVFDLKAGALFKIDTNIDRSQVKELGGTWNSSSV